MSEIHFDLPGIQRCQRNRYPMLFIDAVPRCVPGEYAEAYKLFSYDEWYFHGYETKAPKVWNAIQVEAMSQTFLMTFLSLPEHSGSVAMSSRFDNVQFLKRIQPGDCLILKATLTSFKRGIAKGKIVGTVAGQLACSMECVVVLPELISGTSPGRSAEPMRRLTPPEPLEPVMDIQRIRECLKNKYPWLLIDCATEVVPGSRVVAHKNFTYNEHFFPAHFEGAPSVPGFIQIESCMQAFLLTMLSLQEFKKEETADRKLTNVRIRRTIAPGERLTITAELHKFARGVARGSVVGTVGGDPAISFDVTAVILSAMASMRV